MTFSEGAVSSRQAVQRGVLIIDYGSQYTQLIARRVRELHVYSEICHWRKVNTAYLQERAPACLILSGGPDCVHHDEAAKISEAVFACGLPLLGVCYGMQAMAIQLGGQIESSRRCEYGHARITITRPDDPLFKDCKIDSQDSSPAGLDVWMSHGDHLSRLPPEFETMATSGDSVIAAMVCPSRRYYGLQFHPEVVHTRHGRRMLENFVVHIAGCRADWRISDVQARMIDKIRHAVGREHVILALSGGVDSAVAASLIHKAIGHQLHCIFVDNGLLRAGEAEQVSAGFKRLFGSDLLLVQAGDRFLKTLAGVVDPEEKRRRIGHLFIDVFEEQARRWQQVKWLAQGTIYPDVIESAADTGAASLIKSHHNVGGLPERMNLKLLEPLSLLFKDEVRRLGAELGLSSELLERHPFPGPGLAVRVLGEVSTEKLDVLRRADAIFIEALRQAGFYQRVAQAFAVLLPVHSVSVKGDARHYGCVVVLRAVESEDFMTAHRAVLPDDFLNKVAGRIVNKVAEVSRVCYDLSSKPPATIEWE